MAKITKFGHNAAFFYDRAMHMADLDNDIACLDCLYSAQRLVDPYSENDIALRLEIAETYAKLGLIRESSKEYFKVFEYSGDYLDEVFYGLVRNFYMNGNSETAAYYLSLGVECGAIDPDEFDFDDTLLSGSDRTGLKLLKPPGGEYMISVARQLMAGNDSGYAKQILRSIKPESESYVEAANCLALIELSDNNAAEGLKIVDEALTLNPDDLNSLITKMLALNLAGRTEEIDAIMERIEELESAGWSEYIKLTLACAEMGDSENTYRYSKKALDYTPYEREILLFYAIAAFNIGKRLEAKAAVYKLSVLYPNDYTLKYHARRIDSSPSGTKLDFSTGIDQKTREELAAYLERELARTKNAAEFAARAMTEEPLKDAVMWALMCGNESLNIYIGSVLSLSKAGTRLISDALVDPDYPLSVKKALLSCLLRNTKRKRILVVVGNQIQWLTPGIPLITRNRDFINAYWQVYSSLAFIESGFNRKLNIWYKKIIRALGAKKNVKYKANAVAALIAFKSRASKIFELSSYCCEVFDCETQDFMLYSNIVDSYKFPQRDKKARSKQQND